ncbi:MAG: hypothetical protein KC415_22965 [Anaerolineales bacterium]|nr:hypothetical protein [Anaerolineales bacterium]
MSDADREVIHILVVVSSILVLVMTVRYGIYAYSYDWRKRQIAQGMSGWIAVAMTIFLVLLYVDGGTSW